MKKMSMWYEYQSVQASEGGEKRCPEINKNQLIELRRTLLDLDLDVQVCEMGFCIDEYSNSLTPTLPQNLL